MEADHAKGKAGKGNSDSSKGKAEWVDHTKGKGKDGKAGKGALKGATAESPTGAESTGTTRTVHPYILDSPTFFGDLSDDGNPPGDGNPADDDDV